LYGIKIINNKLFGKITVNYILNRVWADEVPVVPDKEAAGHQ
jgi:hypothetical protein